MEATRETLQRCLVLALTPVLNQMSVMGVVSIPGMMTGQILGGTVPSQVPYCQPAMTSITVLHSKSWLPPPTKRLQVDSAYLLQSRPEVLILWRVFVCCCTSDHLLPSMGPSVDHASCTTAHRAHHWCSSVSAPLTCLSKPTAAVLQVCWAAEGSYRQAWAIGHCCGVLSVNHQRSITPASVVVVCAGCKVPDHDHVSDCSHHLPCGGGLCLLGSAQHHGPPAPPVQRKDPIKSCCWLWCGALDSRPDCKGTAAQLCDLMQAQFVSGEAFCPVWCECRCCQCGMI